MTRNAFKAVVISSIVLVGLVAPWAIRYRGRPMNQKPLVLAANSQSPSLPPPAPEHFLAYWPKARLAFAGYADPVSALQTALWAGSRGDADAVAASVTPQVKSELTKENWNDHGEPADELAASAKQIAISLSPATGFYVIRQKLNSEDEAVLDVYLEGQGETRKFTLKKIGREWKLQSG
jgi:hypothetical protein